jgi:DNA-binding response OmpR family regulator
MDVSMPGISGIDATRQLKDEMPEVKVIVLTIFDLQEYREAAMASGASGYVIKKSLMEELLPAIKRALAQDSAAWARAKEELNITGGETTRQLNNPSHRGQPETYMRAQSGLFHQVRGRSSCIGLREHHPQRHPGHARGRAAGDQDFESFGRRT